MAKEWYCLEISREDDTQMLTRNSKELLVIVDRFGKKHSLDIRFPKNGNLRSVTLPPVSNEYTIVKSISKEEFDKSYHLFLRQLHQYDLTTGEFYWVRNNNQFNKVAWYTIAGRLKEGIQIQWFDGSKDFDISITCIPNWQGIQHFRRSGCIIEASKFNTLFKLLLNFLHDSNDYHNRFRDVVKNFNTLALGETFELETWNKVDLQHSVSVDLITARLKNLERRLLEIDTDSMEDRIKMRGEIEGLRFALSCFN